MQAEHAHPVQARKTRPAARWYALPALSISLSLLASLLFRATRDALALTLLSGCLANAGSDPITYPAPESQANRFQPPKPVRVVSPSGRFALTFPDTSWVPRISQAGQTGKRDDLFVEHRDGRAFVRGHLARRNNAGIQGSLIDESKEAKFLIDYDPESVESDLSEEDYTGSALFCGRRRQGPARKACALVLVALHDREVIQLHALIDADTPRARKRMLADVREIFHQLERLPPPSEAAELEVETNN